MSIACFAAALSAATSIALGSPQTESTGSGAVQSIQAETHLTLNGGTFGMDYSHELDVAPESHPVRFQTGMGPGLKMAASDFSAAKLVKASPALTATPRPKEPPRSYGAITTITENVQALADYYDEAEVRPVDMDDGAGVQYRVKFGAPEAAQK